jgi:hypothetical protein
MNKNGGNTIEGNGNTKLVKLVYKNRFTDDSRV